MRSLNEKFMYDLKNGELNQLLQAVLLDDTLFLGIRNNFIEIYYRGGRLLCVKQNSKYHFDFNFKYCKHFVCPSKYLEILQRNQTAEDWVNSIPYIKAEMDLWFHETKNQLEREIQQIIERDNSNSKRAGETDYFIADIEYANKEVGSQFDLLGIKWPSNKVTRKDNSLPTLAVMELKHCDGALSGSSGIIEHFADIFEYFSNKDKHEAIYQVAETIFNLKVELGLIQGTKKQIKINRGEKTEYILIFSNHKPASSVLLRELEKALLTYPDIVNYVTIKIASSNYMGYGLYADKMIDIDQFILQEKAL